MALRPRAKAYLLLGGVVVLFVGLATASMLLFLYRESLTPVETVTYNSVVIALTVAVLLVLRKRNTGDRNLKGR